MNVTTEGATVTYAVSEDGEYTETNPAYTEPGEYTVWYKIEKPYCETVTGSATVSITREKIQYTASGYSGTYDGNLHWITVNVATEGATVTYAESENGPYSKDSLGFEIPGDYTVWYKIEKPYCETVTGSVTVSIIPMEIEYTVSDYSGMYNRAEHSIKLNILSENVAALFATSEDGPYTSKLPWFADAGEYTVWFRLKGPGYRTVEGSATVTIEKVDYSNRNITEFPTLIAFSGKPVSFEPRILSSGAGSISSWTFTYYDENGDVLASAPSLPGKYSVNMNGEGTNCFARLHHEFTIAPDSAMEPIEYSVQGYSGDYDGMPHTISLNVASDHVTVSYAASQDGPFTETPLAFTDAGSYTVWFKLEGSSHRTIVKSATVQIDPLQIRHGSSSYYGVYDGEAHTITLNVATEGVTVTYATSEDGPYTADMPTFTEPGEYAVWFKLEKANYVTAIKGRTVSITKADVSDQVSFSGESIYPYTGKAVKFSPRCEGVTIWRYAYFDENNVRLAEAPSEPGSYRVEISGEGKYCFAKLSHAYSIAPKGTKLDIEFTVSGYSDYYDGQPHSIALNVTTPEVTVTYATELAGPFTAELPMFTEPGTYIVIYRLERAGYQSIRRTEYVMIQSPPPIKHTVSDYSGVYDGEAHTIDLSVAAEGVAVTYATSENGPYSAELPTFTDPGEYTVWFRLEKGFSITEGSASVNIAKIDVRDRIVLAETLVYYNGKPQAARASFRTELPFGDSMELTLTYNIVGSDEVFSEAPYGPGDYRVKVSGEGKYCYAKRSFGYRIDPPSNLLPMEYSVSGYSGYFDGKPHSITVDVATPGATVRYATSLSGEYTDKNPIFTQPGTYTVYYKIERTYHATATGSAVVEILEHKDKITYAVEGYSGVYDGEAHTIDLQVATPGVKVTYATSKDGTYSDTLPKYAEPGSRTVWFKLEKSGFETCKGSATVTIEKAEQTLYFENSVNLLMPLVGKSEYNDYTMSLIHNKDGGALSFSSSDPERIEILLESFTGNISSAIYYVSYEEWCEGYVAVITATAAETYYYKAATATYTVMADESIRGSFTSTNGSNGGAIEGTPTKDVDFLINVISLKQNIDLTLRPASDEDSKSLLGASSALREKLMAAVGSGQIGTMTVDASLIDSQTGEENHSISGDLLISFTGSLQQRYLENYENMSCYAVHIKQDSTPSPTVTPSPTIAPTATVTPSPTIAPTATDAKGVYVDDSSSFNMTDGSISPKATATDGVYVDDSSSFNMADGSIPSTTTATPSPTAAPATTVTPSPTAAPLATAMPSPTATPATTVTPSPTVPLLATAMPMPTAAPTASATHDNPGVSAAPIMYVNYSLGIDGSPLATATHDIPGVSAAPIMYVNYSLGIGGSSTGSQMMNTNNNSRFYESYLRFKDELRINAGLGDNSSAGSSGKQLLTNAHSDLTVAPIGSLSSKVEFIPCKLTREGVLISDTTTSPFLLIYGPKEAFSNLLTVRAKDGVFIWDGEGHQVAAEPSITEGTTLWYSLDLESWQTEAPEFTDVFWNEDGSVGSWQVYVLAENPDCDPAVCSYTVTIIPAA